MGGGPSKEFESINEDDYARRYQAILQNFVVEKQCSDKIYGNCTIYRYRGKDSTYRIAEVPQFFQNQESMMNAFHSYTNLMEKNLNNLLQIHMCRQSVEDSLCSTSFKVYKLCDYISGTLEQKIQERSAQNNNFREEELWSLYEQLVSVISFMEKHEYLRADTVFIVNQINEQPVYKLYYRSILNYKTNFEDCQKGTTQGRYLTVDGLKQLKENQEYQDAIHQDRFSLGMILLQAAILESLDSCYNYSTFELNINLLSEKFLKMRNSYSNELSNVVYQLLFQDDLGFDWVTLNVQLSSVQLSCGIRIQDQYFNNKLENIPQITDPQVIQNTQQGNVSLNPLINNNNNIQQVLNQSQNNGVIQGNFIGVGGNDIMHQQDQNQQFNNSPQNNILNNGGLYGNNVVTGNFNQYQSVPLNNQQSISNQPFDLNHPNSLLQSNLHSPYNQGIISPSQNQNIFGSPLPNSLSLNAGVAQSNQYGLHSQSNSIFAPQQNMLLLSANKSNQFNNNAYSQYQPINNNNNNNNNNIPIQNNNNNLGAMNLNNQVIDQNMMMQIFQMMQQQMQQQQQQQYIGDSFHQQSNHNNSQMTYSPLRGANIFNQFNQKNQKGYNDNQLDLSRSTTAINGIPRRKTTLSYDDGSFYDGEMVLDYRDGFGKLVFSNKGVYEGTWKLNKMHGKGTLYYPNGDIAYEGDWFEDQFNNFGHLYNGKAQHTKQKFDFKDFSSIKNYWLKYEGEFVLDRKQGFGTLTFTNGERYSGNFKNDAIHGYGLYHQQDGESFSGYWEDNILIKRM